jgi:hypothetical protein
MPSPKKGESRNDYIGRCMGNKKMKKEFSDTKQRAAVCYSYWDKKNESVSLPSFKEFLFETDYGDMQLQQQSRDDQVQRNPAVAATEFSKKMNSTRGPEKGDLIATSKGKYMVLGITPEGIKVKMAGGNETGVIPASQKFKLVGKTDLGKQIWGV